MLIAATLIGCGEIDTIVVFYDNADWACNALEDWEETDLVCNMAVTVADECERLVQWLPDWIPLPDICGFIPDFGNFGTCQAIGDLDDPCAENPDCLSGVCNIAPEDEEGTCG